MHPRPRAEASASPPSEPAEIRRDDEPLDCLEDEGGQLVRALRALGVRAELSKITPGPASATFSFSLEEGVLTPRRAVLAGALAHALEAGPAALEEPTDGGITLRVEVPNPHAPPPRAPREATTIDGLEQRVASTTKGCLNCGGGCDPDVGGGPFCSTECSDAFTADLAEDPEPSRF